jgi:hypothetical protein
MKRLCKQRVETLQILNALSGRSTGWRNHPATKMWRGCERALAAYGAVMCEEWVRRGYRDTTLPKILEIAKDFPEKRWPDWLGDPDFHASHRSNLLRKQPDFYGRYGWKESDDLPYLWPEGKAA